MSWQQRWRGLSSAGFALSTAEEEKAAGLELIHVLLSDQDQSDRLHRYTFIKVIHLAVPSSQYLCMAACVCSCPVLHVLSSCLAGQELCLSHMKLVGEPFPRSVHSPGSRTQHGALVSLGDAHRDPIPERR